MNKVIKNYSETRDYLGRFIKGVKNREYNKPTSYHSIHGWIRWHFGPAQKCENKNCQRKSFIYDYALIRGKKYETKRENYMQLCRLCHVIYDGIIEALTEMKKKPVVAINKLGEKQLFKSGKEASKSLNVLRSGISLCLKGIYKTSGGYKWEYGKSN